MISLYLNGMQQAYSLPDKKNPHTRRYMVLITSAARTLTQQSIKVPFIKEVSSTNTQVFINNDK
jgi:hypothetical protein